MYSLAGFVSGNCKNSAKVSVLEGACTISFYSSICQLRNYSLFYLEVERSILSLCEVIPRLNPCLFHRVDEQPQTCITLRIKAIAFDYCYMGRCTGGLFTCATIFSTSISLGYIPRTDIESWDCNWVSIHWESSLTVSIKAAAFDRKSLVKQAPESLKVNPTLSSSSWTS